MSPMTAERFPGTMKDTRAGVECEPTRTADVRGACVADRWMNAGTQAPATGFQRTEHGVQTSRSAMERR
jgi:hypothetical protein